MERFREKLDQQPRAEHPQRDDHPGVRPGQRADHQRRPGGGAGGGRPGRDLVERRGRSRAGGLMAFYVLLLRLYGPAGLFAGAFQTLTLSADGLERVHGGPESEGRGRTRRTPSTLGPLREAIRFEKLGYAPTKGKSVLKDLDVEIARGIEDRLRRADRRRQGGPDAAPAPRGRRDRGQDHLGRHRPEARPRASRSATRSSCCRRTRSS